MTDLIHVDDLTTNVVRFDMLDYDTQQRLEALPRDERECWRCERWADDDRDRVFYYRTYRQKPKSRPETAVLYKPVYDFGAANSWHSLEEAKSDCPEALSFLRIETCTKTGKLISAENVELGDE